LSSSSLLLELLRDTLELDVVGRERVFVEEERLTLVLDFDELFVLERLTLEFARVLLEFEILLPYFGREPLLLVVEEYDRLDDVVDGRL
jgi:hypothetical protein